MPKNRLLTCYSPGYWGGDPYNRIQGEHLTDKVLSLNFDKIKANGLPVALWREASVFSDALTRCSCYKETSKQSDIPCQSCYGTSHIPGYFKYGTRTFWAASIDPGWTLSGGMVLDTNNRPNRLMLDPAWTTGTAVSPVIPIDVTGKLGSWEAKSDLMLREVAGNSTATTEISKDGGTTWVPLDQINVLAPTTQIQFRITMTRTSLAVKSPFFEIVRARFPIWLDISNRMNEPVIRIISTWLQEALYRDRYGDKFESPGMAFWTLPLAFFDNTMAATDIKSRLADDAFLEIRYGNEIGYRYALVNFAYSEGFEGVFTRQQFQLRKVTGEPGKMQSEVYYRIW